MRTQLVVETDVGTFAPTPEMEAAFSASRMTKKNQPDLRTKTGRRAWHLFKLFSAEKLEQYRRGEI